MENLENVIKAIMESGFCTIGIRHLSDDESYSVGDYCRNSFDWDYEYDRSTYDTESPVELSGTCAIRTNIDVGWDENEEVMEKLTSALEKAKCYFGTTIVIGGDRFEYGNDDGEIIIKDAQVVAFI